MISLLLVPLILQVALGANVDFGTGCSNASISANSTRNSVVWNSGDGTYMPSQTCTLTFSWPASTYLNLTVESILRANTADSLVVFDDIEQLLSVSSNERTIEVYRVPNGNSMENRVTVRLATDGSRFDDGLVIVMFNSVPIPSLESREENRVLLSEHHMSAVEPLELIANKNMVLLFWSGLPNNDPFDFLLLSERALTGEERSSLRNVFIFQGDSSNSSPICRLTAALVPDGCKTSFGQAYVLSLDDAPSELLVLLTLIVTRVKYSVKPIDYVPTYVEGGAALTTLTYTQQYAWKVPILLKKYADRSHGLYVNSIEFTPSSEKDELSLLIGGVQNNGSDYELLRTNHKDAPTWNTFFVNTKFGISLHMPAGCSATVVVGIDDYYTVMSRPIGSRGVILSDRNYPHPNHNQHPFTFTLATSNALTTFSFAGTWLGTGTGSLTLTFNNDDPAVNSHVTKTYTGLASPLGLSINATEALVAYSPDITTHSGFILQYHITDANDPNVIVTVPTVIPTASHTTTTPKPTTKAAASLLGMLTTLVLTALAAK